ncbi:MAG: hypothetical protein ACP5SI_03500 [Chloroflexia bacterium]
MAHSRPGIERRPYTFDMRFYPPKTRDINSGGAKDYFGCEQIPDPQGSPGEWGTFPNYRGTGFSLRMTVPNSGAGCTQSRFTFTYRNGGPFVLHPGENIVFTVDMVTRVNQGGQQEYTSCEPHYLNSGFTVKWFQSDDGVLHSFTTFPPIEVNVGGGEGDAREDVCCAEERGTCLGGGSPRASGIGETPRSLPDTYVQPVLTTSTSPGRTPG